MSKENCCDSSCNGCPTDEKMINGYINIYDIGGLYQAMSAIYDTEERAIETSKMVKGYVGTVFISLNKKGA
ncbi:MAG: hypothetical protein AAB706_03170 [Patescibacteria group bacterium]